ncbi:avidin/streptavidin family protein [Paraherbaspirillum soli]|uniref:Avidin/streptavidin family protein n=1 Tax=Paraherbaspirillum soli TaxID=631222 RepID=A0ABW0MCU8_9BURK
MNISGVWYNELNSTMTIEQNGNVLTGTYQTGVGTAQGRYPLQGMINSSGDASQTTAWSVAWVNPSGNSHSTTAWCGQLQTNGNHQPVLIAMWLLTSETSPSQDWASTQIGQDVFTRQRPTDDMVSKALARGHFSHPVQKA